jgi:hypothetical protein
MEPSSPIHTASLKTVASLKLNTERFPRRVSDVVFPFMLKVIYDNDPVALPSNFSLSNF